MRTPPPGEAVSVSTCCTSASSPSRWLGSRPARAPGKFHHQLRFARHFPGAHPGGRRPVQNHGEEGVLRHLAQPQAAHFHGVAGPPGVMGEAEQQQEQPEQPPQTSARFIGQSL